MLFFVVRYPSVVFGVLLILGCMYRWFIVPVDRRRTEYVLTATVFAFVVALCAQAIADQMSRLAPLKYDLYMYRFDAIFGQPSFVLGRIAQRHLWMKMVLNTFYGALPTAVTVVVVTYIYLREAELKAVLKALIINLVAAPVFYLIIPVCGPQFAFPEFPRDPGQVATHPLRLAAAPNGFPSVHASTALLLLWVCRRWRTGAIVGGVYLVLIVISTLASGQHYLVDLLAAIPYTALVARLAGLHTNARLKPADKRVAIP